MPESHGSNQQWVASQALISYRRALALTRSAVGHVQAGLGLRECVRANARRYHLQKIKCDSPDDDEPTLTILPGGPILDLNHVYFEKRSFSSSGSRRSLTQ